VWRLQRLRRAGLRGLRRTGLRRLRRTGLRRARLCSSRLRSRLPRLRSARVWRLWLCSLRGLRLRNVLDMDALGLGPGLLTETQA